MGWTGMFDWNTWEKNWEILNREFFSGDTKFEPLKWSDKGGHVWCLFKNKETGEIYAEVTLCKRYTKDHEFCYKSMGIDCGPYVYDMPKSWLPLLSKEYQEHEFSRDWFKRRDEWEQEKKTKFKFEIGDYFKCEAKYDIEWNDGFKIKENEVFYINISCLNPYAKKKTKAFAVVRPGMEYGGGYVMQRSYHRLSASTFKNLKSVVKLSEDEVKQICEDYHQKVLEKAKKDFGVA